MEIARLVDV